MFHSSRRQFIEAASFSAAGLLLSGSIRAAAQSADALHAISQSVTRLDDGWQFRRETSGEVENVWLSEAHDPWQQVVLPHCFNGMDACDPDKPYFRGQGWYRTRLSLRNPFAGGRAILYFRGAGQTTSVWIGSTLIGKHKGGYDEFAFDITDAVAQLPPAQQSGGVPLAVLSDNSPDRDRVPSDLSDFCLFGGLYRHVSLIYLPAVALEAVHVLPIVGSDGTAQVSVKARLYNPSGADSLCKLSVDVLDPSGRSIHQSSQNFSALSAGKDFATLASFAIAAPNLWSPDSPSLYSCRVTLSSSAGEMFAEERFGIRHIEFLEHGPFKLNGKRVLLRGTQRHADHAEVAAAMSDEQVREEMRLIREMGANFIRLGHYQQDRLVLDLCDELGLMVWEEVPWCRAGVGGEAFQQNAKDMLTHMIEQHYNHPSVVFWGLGNEDDWPEEYPSVDKQAIRTFMAELNDLAHGLDNSRLTAFRRCDFARDIPDVYSPSIWAGWYSGKYREYEQSLNTERERVKRFIHIEWGADSHAGRHAEDPEAGLSDIATGKGTDERGLAYLKAGGDERASSDGDWSETYACNLFDWHLKTQEKLDWLSGSAHWIFKDFASPLRGDNGIPRVNQKGVVERDLTKKESYYLFQSYWAQKPMVHIYGHSWPVRWGRPGELRNVRIFSNCDQAELFLNGKPLGAKKRDSQDFPAAGLRWDVTFQPGPNHLRAVATKNGITVADEIDLIYQTDTWGKPANLRLGQKSRDGDRITVEAKLFDANGVLCLDSQALVSFSLAGDGRLIDNLGTTRASRELQLANGRAEISFDSKGTCSIEAAVAGVPAASFKI